MICYELNCKIFHKAFYHTPHTHIHIYIYIYIYIFIYIYIYIYNAYTHGASSFGVMANMINSEIMIWFGLLGFYGISTFVGYLTPNPFLCE